jgi:5-methylcytosine-specific restriction endonuclease McrBC GTP-binding regulatory subunit McrB
MRDGLRLPPNLIVIGTVNMDETTHQFSRKVIDRAMTIEMNIGEGTAPFQQFFDGYQELGYRENPLPAELFLPTVTSADEALRKKLKAEDAEFLKQNVPTLLNDLNTALNNTPFKVAYRVQNELVLYFAALRQDYPDKLAEELLRRAMDDILMMKVLPRIQGDEDMLEIPLKSLAKFTDSHNYSRASEKIKEMNGRLEPQHFTSFWP